MSIVITGGGTGGHIYPALEIAKALRAGGAPVTYIGSLRGQESALCAREGFKFQGYPVEPLYSLRQPRGWKSMAGLLRATHQLKSIFKASRPIAVFSTGGYSAAPVMAAAKALRIPYVIHEANSVPGRSNRMFSGAATSFTCVFEKTLSVIPKATRTGQPIRSELRAASEGEKTKTLLTLALGGSQGSQFINQLVVGAAELPSDLEWLLAAGKGNFDKLEKKVNPKLKALPYLETDGMVDAYRRARVVVARSGGTLAELAMFGIPSVLIPLPTSADDHQTENAKEFVGMGGAKILMQSNATAQSLLSAIQDWLSDEEAYDRAQIALKKWDRPDATPSITALVRQAAALN